MFLLGSLLFFACNKEELNVNEQSTPTIEETADEVIPVEEAEELSFTYIESDEPDDAGAAQIFCVYRIDQIRANDCYARGDMLCLPCPNDGRCPIAINRLATITKYMANGEVIEIKLRVTGGGACKPCPAGGKKLRWG